MSVSAVKNENWKPESAHGRKDGREKMLRQETLWQSRPVRSNGFAWKINYCGIFCNPKTVLRIMKKYDLLSEIRRRRKWQQMGRRHINTRIY